MNRDIQLLFQINGGGNIDADESIRVNRALAFTKIQDIPLDQRENVKNYLVTALIMNSVEHSLVNSLNELLECLQEADNI